MRKGIEISPSLLSALPGEYSRELDRIYAAECDWVHYDVMDGNFVKPITYGAGVLKALRKRDQDHLMFDAHLMVENTEEQVEQFLEAGADMITVHAESTRDIPKTLERICSMNGVRAGLAFKPNTALFTVDFSELRGLLDHLLIMTVEPGYAGQKYIEDSDARIQHARETLEKYEIGATLGVDGGICAETVQRAVRAGAKYLVAGSAVFGDSSPNGRERRITRNIENLRELAESALL